MTRQPVVELMAPMMAEIMRNKTPAQRLAIAFRMWNNALIQMIVMEHNDFGLNVYQQRHGHFADGWSSGLVHPGR